MRWSDRFDAMNPGNVPRFVLYKDQAFMPLERRSDMQARQVQSLLDEVGGTAPPLFGEGFESLDGISSWAASWAITELENLRDEQQSEERLVKAQMAQVLREKWPHLRWQQMPVRFCKACDGMRPHDGCRCMACEVSDDGAA